MDDRDVTYEIARDIISRYFAITACELAEEKARKNLDTEAIEQLEGRLKLLHKERIELSTYNIALISKVFTEYVMAIKER